MMISASPFHIDDTNRAFIEPGYYMSFPLVSSNGKADVVGTILNFRQAWGIRPNELTDICQKYKLDMKVETTECGGRFTEYYEYVNGSVTYQSKDDYKDWFWEVRNPFDGG